MSGAMVVLGAVGCAAWGWMLGWVTRDLRTLRVVFRPWLARSQVTLAELRAAVDNPAEFNRIEARLNAETAAYDAAWRAFTGQVAP
jgi:hypothetical protein